MQKYLAIALFALCAAACSPTEKPAAQTAVSQPSPTSANKKIVLIDVRSAEEFREGHLTGAFNISHEQIAQRIAETGADKDTEIHLYCRSGSRAGQAQQALQDLGFTRVKNLGAYSDLIKQQ